jgi:hypothetical protein
MSHIHKGIKGAQAWDILLRVFYAIQACMG